MAAGAAAVATLPSGELPGVARVGRAAAASLADAIARAIGSGRYVAGVDGSYWGHAQQAVLLDPGVYEAGNLPLTGSTPHAQLTLLAAPGSVVIRIPDDQYLFVCREPLTRFLASGITFAGGKGVLAHDFAGSNVGGLIEFDHCVFDNYTECAIGNAAEDAPYLRVRDCTFMARKGAPAIGIAWGGWLDNCIIEANAFLRNRYHLKIGPRLGGSLHVLRNDFINWGETARAADIWLVPDTTPGNYGTNAGSGTVISGNKFGNEHLEPDDVRVLVALEGEGSSRRTRHHATRFDRGGAHGAFVTGISILHSRIVANDTIAAPFLRSYIAELRGLTYAGNRHDGGRHSWLCEFMGPRTGDYANSDWLIDVAAPGGAPFARGITNAPVGLVTDHDGGLAVFEEVALEPSGGDATSFRELLRADQPGAFLPFGDTAAGPVADHAGQPRAAEIAVRRPLGGVAMPLASPIPGRQSRLALDLRGIAPGSGTAIVEIFNHAEQRTARRLRYPLPNDWRRVRASFTLPASAHADAWQLRVYPEGEGQARFQIARAHVYHGREAMRDGDLRTLGDGSWNGGHLVMGQAHLWLHAGRLFVKPDGAPASPTDGRPLG